MCPPVPTMLGIWFNSPAENSRSPQLRRIVADHAVAADRAAGDGTAGLPGPDRAPHVRIRRGICGSQVIGE